MLNLGRLSMRSLAAALTAGMSAVLIGAGGTAASATAQALEPASGGTISTIAGGTGGPSPATTVALQQPCGLASGGGELYIGEGNSVVQRVSEHSDWLTTAAGTGVQSSPGGVAPATQSNISWPCTTTVDGAGNLLLTQGDVLMAVAARTGHFYGLRMVAGNLYTIAGNGQQGYSGDGGPARRAELTGPTALAVDHFGNVVLADGGYMRVVAVRSGTFYGRRMTAGDIYTIAGGGASPVRNGQPAANARIDSAGMAVDAAGNLVIADDNDYRIVVLPARSGTFYGQRMKLRHLYVVAGDGSRGFSGDGGAATKAELDLPAGVAIGQAGSLVIADQQDNRLRVVAVRAAHVYGRTMRAGRIYTVAGTGADGVTGDGGPAAKAELDQPNSIATDEAGNVIVAGGTLDDLVADDIIRVIAAKNGYFFGRRMRAGDIYRVAGTSYHMFTFGGNGGLATAAQLGEWHAIALDHSGNLILTDAQNNQVRMVAGTTGSFYGQHVTAGHIYAIAGTGVAGFAGDGGPGPAAELRFPMGVALDASGNLVISDTFSSRIRVLAARSGDFYGQAMTAGDIYTIGGTGVQGYSGDGGPAADAELSDPAAVAFDPAGNLVFVDSANGRLRVIAATDGTFYGQNMNAGDIYTVAGGGASTVSGVPAASAQLPMNFASGLVIDAAGNVLVTAGSGTVVLVAESSGTFYGQSVIAGHLYTIAGTGSQGFDPTGLAIDPAGNLVVSDLNNDRIRVVAETTGTFYGQDMTAGDIYTIAGDGSLGYSGDGGPAGAAALDAPEALLFTPAGNLIVADDIRIREITY